MSVENQRHSSHQNVAINAAEICYNFYRKAKGKTISKMHAQQLLFAAQAGDASVITALTEMGVQTTELEDPEVWSKNTDRLAALMDQASPIFSKAYIDTAAIEANPDGSKAKTQKKNFKKGEEFGQDEATDAADQERSDAIRKGLADSGIS